jgi:hypothetical protein
MVRAILDGRKTQTRRVVKNVPALGGPMMWCHKIGGVSLGRIIGDYRRFCPYGQPGDRLWVRETHLFFRRRQWAHLRCCKSKLKSKDGISTRCFYKEDIERHDRIFLIRDKWRPSIYMPRWASRITLEVTDVRVERVQSISARDAHSEGIGAIPYVTEDWEIIEDFAGLWDSINAKRGFSWESNPWVWVVEFVVVKP